MAEVSIIDTENQNNQLLNNLPARVMRKAIETKGLLDEKGKMYCGTGLFDEVSIGGNTYKIPKTGVIGLPQNDGTYVLKCTVSGGTVTDISWVEET